MNETGSPSPVQVTHFVMSERLRCPGTKDTAGHDTSVTNCTHYRKHVTLQLNLLADPGFSCSDSMSDPENDPGQDEGA